MTQTQLERRVARATGESLHEIRRRGFSVADPLTVAYDPEPDQRPPQQIDWDDLDLQRTTAFFPQANPSRRQFA